MQSKLTIDFGIGRSVLDTTTPSKPGTPSVDAQERKKVTVTMEDLINHRCPHETMVGKQWNPKWDEYVHSHKYNYSITINTDPKAEWYQKIRRQDRIEDHIIIQQIRDEEERRLKKLVAEAYRRKLVKNVTIVYEYGENNKKHYHMLVLTSRKNQLKMLIEESMEMSMEAHGTGWKKRDPINLIRPKKMKSCYDVRTACQKAKEVIEAIDYIIYKYYQKENLGENLLINLITKI